jgi:putative heme-binding domain-containing protein
MGSIGQSIGPNLTQINDKLDKYGLFEAIVYPSSSIVFGYESYLIRTKNGQNYYGFIIGENEKSITLKDISNQNITLAKNLIISRIKDKKSILPSASSQ